MKKRTLINAFDGVAIYKSSFDPKTGMIVRETVEDNENAINVDLRHHVAYKAGKVKPEYIRGEYFWNYKEIDEYSENVFKGLSRWRMEKSFSPVPETVDIKITDWCDFGCSYCYMDSTKKTKQTDAITLVKNIIEGFDQRPYQFAFGGGEPCSYKDLPELLKITRELGVVPNFTTAGHIFREDVVEAANKYCGGVALTYHRFKGKDYFKNTFVKWREALKIQMNIHVIADIDVVKSLIELADIQEETGYKMNIVLLAFYPNVGRADYTRIMPKSVFHASLPPILSVMEKSKNFNIAFSEGLLPYFNSRNIIDTTMATTQEGRFSCYIDNNGRMSHSSFEAPHDKSPTIFETRSQELWNGISLFKYSSGFCEGCPKNFKCSSPDQTHKLNCAYSPMNDGETHSEKYERWNINRNNPKNFFKHISAIGSFVTNSSSVICSFPKAILENPQVKAIIDAYVFNMDHVGDVWNRGGCGSIVSTKEQKIYLKRELSQYPWDGSDNEVSRETGFVNTDDENVYLIYGDEYDTPESTFLHLLKDVLGDKLVYSLQDDYN